MYGSPAATRQRRRAALPIALCASFGLAGVAASAAQFTTQRELPAVKVDVPPVIDGILNDACWRTLPSSTGFTDRITGALVKDDTTVWIGYDDKKVYVAFHCRDSRPAAIIARETKRGTYFQGEDRIRFRLNPYNSKQGSDESEMNVNALGTQFADFAGGHANKEEWAGAWESASRIVDDGWTCEIAVPWSDFARPATDGKPAVLGVNFERYQARTDVYSYWSNLGPQERRDWGGQWHGVILPTDNGRKRVSILGYSYGGTERERGVQRQGLDARYQFTPSLTGLATYNPDFSNVEGAVTSIDFSYAERLPGETRPFFQEGGDYCDWGMNGVSPFASVRVPSFDLGGRFYGRVGQSTDIGLLTTQDLGDRNDTVAYLKQTLSPFDVLSFEAASLVASGVSNQVLGGKAKMRRGDWTVTLGGSASVDQGPVSDTDPTIRDTRSGAGTAALNWSKNAWWASGNLVTIGRDFMARDGYVPYVDQQGYTLGAGYGTQWRSGLVRSLGANLNYLDFRHQDRSFFRNRLDAHLDFRTSLDLLAFADYSVGRYEENNDFLYHAGFRYPSMNKFCNYGLDAYWGRQDGAPYSAIGPQVTWRFLDRLSVGLAVEVVNLRGRDEQDVLSLSYDIRNDLGVGGRLVRRDGRANWYLSCRKSGYGGTEAFVILGDPNSETFTRRLILKVVRPL